MTKKILIADDEPNIILMVKSRLKANGFEVTTASRGSQIMGLALEVAPDLVLLDILIPDKDGFEVLEELKSNEKTRDIPVIMLSARGQRDDLARAKQLGAFDFIVKPFQPHLFIEKIKSALQ